MKCYICKKNFNEKISFSNLFKPKMLFICDDCYRRYPINISYTEVPVGKGIRIYSLFPKKYKINTNAFILEYSRIYEFIAEIKNRYILLFDNFYLTDKMEKFIEAFSSLFDGEIFILCNYFGY